MKFYIKELKNHTELPIIHKCNFRSKLQYLVVTYPTKNPNEIPKGSIGLHCVEGEDETELRNKYENSYENKNLILIDMFGNRRKMEFKWFGEYKL